MAAEVLIAAGLAGAGFLFNQQRAGRSATAGPTVPPIAAQPSQTTAHETTALDVLYRAERRDVEASLRRAGPPDRPLAPRREGTGGRPTNGVWSPLLGRWLTPEQFGHANPVPFFGGGVHQNTAPRATATLLEHYTGLPSEGTDMRHVETVSFADIAPDRIQGGQTIGELQQERAALAMSDRQNNALPFAQQRVGPGLGVAYDAGPTGGYQQVDFQDKVLPPTVDQLRPAKPRITYAMRAVNGLTFEAGPQPAQIGTLQKERRANTAELQGLDHALPGTAAVLTAPVPRPLFFVTQQHSGDTARVGPAGSAALSSLPPAHPAYVDGCGRAGRGTQLAGAQGLMGAEASLVGYAADPNALARASAPSRPGAHLTPTVAQPLANAAGVAVSGGGLGPVDQREAGWATRTNRRDFTQLDARMFGNFQRQAPGQLPILEGGHGLRRTLRETMTTDARDANMGGALPKVMAVLDPGFSLQPTLRETLVVAQPAANLRGSATTWAGRDGRENPVKTTVRATTDPGFRQGSVGGLAGPGAPAPQPGGYTTNNVAAPRGDRPTREHFGATTLPVAGGAYANAVACDPGAFVTTLIDLPPRSMPAAEDRTGGAGQLFTAPPDQCALRSYVTSGHREATELMRLPTARGIDELPNPEMLRLTRQGPACPAAARSAQNPDRVYQPTPGPGSVHLTVLTTRDDTSWNRRLNGDEIAALGTNDYNQDVRRPQPAEMRMVAMAPEDGGRPPPPQMAF